MLKREKVEVRNKIFKNFLSYTYKFIDPRSPKFNAKLETNSNGPTKKTKTGQMAKIKGSKTEHKLEAQPNLDSIVVQYTPNAHSISRVFSRQQGTLPLPSLWAKPPATPPHLTVELEQKPRAKAASS